MILEDETRQVYNKVLNAAYSFAALSGRLRRTSGVPPILVPFGTLIMVYCGCEVLIRDLQWIRSRPSSCKDVVRFRETEAALRDLLDLFLDLLRLYPAVQTTVAKLYGLLLGNESYDTI